MNLTSCLRQTIIIQKPYSISDGMGGQVEAWQDFATIRAEVKAISENGVGEVFASMQLMDASLYRFRIRYLWGVVNNMRILYNQRYFQIKRVVNHHELNSIIIIIAQESL